MSSAASQAEATVLNLLVRNWRNIANHTERYADLVRNKPAKEKE